MRPLAPSGEGLAVGRDSGDPFSGAYPCGFAFRGGRVLKVVYAVAGDAYIDLERRMAARLARE